ncbi:hypothetical protein [Tissierella sp.]|uniref:hypothetical protein n=1 Tax=Tissierella sp. TaxID=41274 RepID=UPI00285767B6|nr:hypothetical protein [Tissierella sp.]MDR7856269.1 hypothetical protein [Tissierella sp.]
MDVDVIETTVKKKGKKRYKILTILIVVFVAVPLAIISLIYANNKTFQTKVKGLLMKMPGVVGEHFRNYPTETERNEKIEYLSRYFLDMDTNISADKIYIIKKDDEKLYTDLIRGMNAISTSKAEEIVIKVRNIELRKDLLFSLYDDAQKDENEQFLSEVSRIEKQDILLSILEAEERFSDREFLNILDKLNTDKLGEIIFYTDDEIKNYILNAFKENKRTLIERIIFEKTNTKNTLIDLGKLYETKSIDMALNIIGNTDTYNMEKLGTIYKNLSVLKSAELLINIKDEKFLEELFSAIIREEALTKSDTNITRDISSAMEFLNEYNTKIKDLVVIYEKMSPSNVANIVEEMMTSTNIITSLELNSENVYDLSDSVIIVDVLSNMKNQTLSKVLDFMEPNKASQITQLLAKPKENN